MSRKHKDILNTLSIRQQCLSELDFGLLFKESLLVNYIMDRSETRKTILAVNLVGN